MRVRVLLIAVFMAVVPLMAKGSHRGYGRSSGTRSYSSHSYHSCSSSSSYRSRSSTNHAFRSHRSHSGHHSYGTRSYKAGRTSSYGAIRRDSHGRIERSEAAKDAFKRQHPCPSTGKGSGVCPGYVIDHVKPLANGGADDLSNMQWQTTADAKAEDKWERKH